MSGKRIVRCMSTRLCLDGELGDVLGRVRGRRHFDVAKYVEGKVTLLNAYLNASGLKSCVVGVSGGVDSAVVLGLLLRASRSSTSPIRRIVAALLPIFDSAGASNQDVALARGREVIERFGCAETLVDLSASHDVLQRTVDASMGMVGNGWSAGQLVSYLRTPALFYLTSLLSQEGLPSIVVGTTNRDEGALIGYFGKAADGMVDVQLISDLHKSEVFAVARFLDVPSSVLNAAPTGDIYDGRTDEELIGVSYEALELFILYLCSKKSDQEDLLRDVSVTGRDRFGAIEKKLLQMNGECAHKYIGESPAVHLDVYRRDVPHGWRNLSFFDQRMEAKAPTSAFVNLIDLPWAMVERFRVHPIPALIKEVHCHLGDSLYLLKNVFTDDECADLVESVRGIRWTAVGLNGMAKDYREGEDRIGSYRATTVNEALSDLLWSRVSSAVPSLKFVDDLSCSVGEDRSIWRSVGISPVFRFIRYEGEGSLIGHYDSSYVYDEGKKTLMSVLVYLCELDAGGGGATRFLRDLQRHKPFRERIFTDWPRLGNEEEVLHRVCPSRGSVLLFDHRLLHDSQSMEKTGEKLVMRTDLIFERCGLDEHRCGKESKPLGLPRSVVEEDRPSRSSSSSLVVRRRLDPFYESLFDASGSMDLVLQGGYFDDGSDESVLSDRRCSARWFVTPVHKLVERLQHAPSDRSFAVLVTTGAFCPVHHGHLQMMEKAKMDVEERGAFVIGGYLSPSHDRYVREKCGANVLNAAERMSMCEEAVKDIDWLLVDPWESIHCDYPINFSDVLLRLEEYLAFHLRTLKSVEIVYVFGSDHADFSWTFLRRGRAICVSRPGFTDELHRVSQHPLIRSNERIRFVRTDGVTISSSELRERMNVRDGLVATPSPSIHFLRNEEDWSVLPWMNNRDERVIRQSWTKFLHGLTSLLGRCSSPSTRLVVVHLSDQRRLAKELTEGYSVISLDPCLPSLHNLSVSRRFACGSGRCSSQIVARPSSPSLLEQIDRIPDGEYLLFDDDIATGSTMQQIRSLLPPRIRIVKTVALVQFDVADDPVELSDCRDFLVGSRQGGLVIGTSSSSSSVRLPYFRPYVSPHERLNIDLSSEWSFSVALWKLNVQFFESIDPRIVLHESDPSFREAMISLGFSDNDTLLHICEWHLARMPSPATLGNDDL